MSRQTRRRVRQSAAGRTIAAYVEHYPWERNRQGMENEVIDGVPAPSAIGGFVGVRGVVLNYYERAA
jgi:hypothetical protein